MFKEECEIKKHILPFFTKKVYDFCNIYLFKLSYYKGEKYMKDIEKIYREYFCFVYKYLFCLSHDTNLSEELTQETFFKAILKINTFKEESKISTWLCQIARNLFYNEINKKKISNFSEESALDNIISLENIENNFIKNEEQEELFRKMKSLDETTYRVMYLRIYGEFSFKEISEILRKK